MSDYYYFPGEFKCMYCKEDFDSSGQLALPSGDSIDLKCPKCDSVWRFWVNVSLCHKLLKKGKYHENKLL